MSIEIEVDKRDTDRLANLFKEAEAYTTKQAEDLIRQTMLFAVQSAANATKPIGSLNKSGNFRKKKLAKKHLFRPLVKLPSDMGFWYYQEGRFKPFQLPRKLKPKEMRAKKLIRITKAIKMWNRKGGGWKYLPFAGTKASTRDSRLRIPYAGLAKDGWYRAAAGLDKKLRVDSLVANRRVHGLHTLTKGFLYLMVANKVSYVSNSSPGAARYGLNRAKNRMVKIYQPKIDKKIQRELNKRR